MESYHEIVDVKKINFEGKILFNTTIYSLYLFHPTFRYLDVEV